MQGTHGPFAWGYDFVRDEGNTPGGGVAQQGATTGAKLRLAYRYMPAGQIAFLSVVSVVENGGPANAGASGTALPGNCNGTTAATTCDFSQGGAGFSWDHMFGPIHLIAQYYTIGKIKISGSGTTTCTTPGGGTECADTGAKQITVGARYIFSKRTHVYVSYNKIDNEAQYNQDFTGASLTARSAAGVQAVGADPTIIAVGMIHNF